MANYQPQHAFPSELTVCDPAFRRPSMLWVVQAKSEMADLVEATKEQIAISCELLSEVDRVLARNTLCKIS